MQEVTSKQSNWQVQKPRGRNMSGMLEEQPGGRYGGEEGARGR